MIQIGQLETFALVSMASGILYSIVVLTFESKTNPCHRIHFLVLTLILFAALLSLSVFKYLKCRYACHDLIRAMKVK